ncbi:YndM family protein [Bacillus benzoevorans]|uniref:DUF2512 family protein n=1 Tax=Bacillus benzoevorans TaxID=1456 RepID=A0A7X0LW30_9BACI|nr:YndM family protein [Bacillus benzoevorans]MBB6446263.1 hypothetical protein [Bacillus benzoevorans]
MKHLWALLIKFAAIGTVLFSIYGIFDPAMTVLLIMTGITTFVTYFLGDMVVLPKLGNFMAIAGDLVLSFLLVWGMSFLFLDTTFNRVTAGVISAASITAIEVLFHLYVKRHIFTNSAESYIPAVSRNDGYATEFSEEMNDLKKTQQNENGQS